MKYVIDISENRLDVLRMFYKDCQDNLSTSDIAIVEGKPLDDVLDKIRTEIQKLRGCSCECSDGIIDDVEDIIDKYRAESEE